MINDQGGWTHKVKQFFSFFFLCCQYNKNLGEEEVMTGKYRKHTQEMPK